jgi:hypothetical protein
VRWQENAVQASPKQASAKRASNGRTPIEREMRSAIKARREAMSGGPASPSPLPIKSSSLFDNLAVPAAAAAAAAASACDATTKIDAVASEALQPQGARKLPTPLRKAIAAKYAHHRRLELHTRVATSATDAFVPRASAQGALIHLQGGRRQVAARRPVARQAHRRRRAARRAAAEEA